MRLLRNGEVMSGVVLAALGCFIVAEARQWEYLGPDGPGPGFFPMWYGAGLVVLSLVLIAMHARKAVPAASAGKVGMGRAFTAWGALAACVALLNWLGFIVAYTLFTIFIVRILYRESLAKAAAIAAGGAVGFYLLFDVALDVSLPVGVLGF